ncbi:MAG: hypothetical protein N3D20_00935, partial [Candidatus Pacearchaeota archaeon]|nr:hypothetical protein [Candidatus Pacearchaeota archaeon]
AGWYYASNDYYWQGSYYNWANLLKRFPTVEGSITDIANYDVSPGYALTTVSNGLNMIYWGGPTRGWRQTPSSVPGVKLLGFSAIPGNLSAAVKNGKMLLLSTHPEAYENDGIVGLSTEQRIENYKWLANAINDVAGTNFYVPPYKQCIDGIDNDGDGFIDYSSDPGCSSALDDNESDNPQCSDGIDNDGDNLVDYPNDSDCTSLRDNSEYYVSGPIELLNESFESGSLTEWTLITASGANPWTRATTNPYQGTYYAEAMPQSTTEPASVMEKTISTSGYENIRFNYYRRLIGLDPADEFKAKWYDGSTWYVLEETASNSANDANYVFKNFSLPSSANNNPNFKIRFECTAGAVSEFCRVDNVKIIAN